MQRRNLNENRANEANYLFINSESKKISGNNNNFSFDLSDFPVIKNKAYNLFIKSVYYPTTINQITSLYNYNSFTMEAVHTGGGVVEINTHIVTIAEGTYNTSQYAQAVAKAINTICDANEYDKVNMGYDDIRNRFYFTRENNQASTRNLVILSNDSLSQYNGEYGFGGAYILGLNYNSSFTIGQNTAESYYLPNPGNLQPYAYFFMGIQGVTNLNYNTDIPERFDILYRCPLNLSSSKYQYAFIEESNETFTQMTFSVLPTRMHISFIDQYNNLVNFPQTASVDITIKLVPLE